MSQDDKVPAIALTFDDVLIYLERYTAPGSEVTLTVLRDGEEIRLTLTLAKRARM